MNSSVSSRAFNVIMGKATKESVIRFSLTLSTLQEVEEATNTFHRQGPRLWGFWCKAMEQRKKNNMVVPSYF